MHLNKKKIEVKKPVLDDYFLFLNESIDDSQFVYALLVNDGLDLSKFNKDLVHYHSIETLLNRRFKMVSEDPDRVKDSKKFLVVDSEDKTWFVDEKLTLLFLNKPTLDINKVTINDILKTEIGSLEYFFKKYTNKTPVYK